MNESPCIQKAQFLFLEGKGKGEETKIGWLLNFDFELSTSLSIKLLITIFFHFYN
jgi:hypothetical protein